MFSTSQLVFLYLVYLLGFIRSFYYVFNCQLTIIIYAKSCIVLPDTWLNRTTFHKMVRMVDVDNNDVLTMGLVTICLIKLSIRYRTIKYHRLCVQFN